jgi:hypothetical protein
LSIRWTTLLGPGAVAPLWSVEHCRMRRLPLASFETLLRAAIPFRYWRGVSLHHPVRPMRLALWWSVPAVVAWLIVFGVECFDLWYWMASRPPQWRYTPTLDHMLRLAWRPIVSVSWYDQSEGWATDPVVIGSLGISSGFALAATVARSVRKPRILQRHLVRAWFISLAGPIAYVAAGVLDEVRVRAMEDAYYFRGLHGEWRIVTLLGLSIWFAWFWRTAFHDGFQISRCWPLIVAGWWIGVPLGVLLAIGVDAWALTLFT